MQEVLNAEEDKKKDKKKNKVVSNRLHSLYCIHTRTHTHKMTRDTTSLCYQSLVEPLHKLILCEFFISCKINCLLVSYYPLTNSNAAIQLVPDCILCSKVACRTD